MKKGFLIDLFLLLCAGILTAQNKNEVQQSALGVHFFINDFHLKDSQTNIKPGLAISFMTGLSPHVDFVGMVAGSFPAFATGDNHFLLETDASLRYKILSNKYWISPYLQGGIGVAKFSRSYALYIPAGLGIQIKLFEEAYFIANAQYRTLTSSLQPNHLFFSIGVAGTMNRRKKTVKLKPAEVIVIPAKMSFKDTDGDGIPDSIDACPLIRGYAKYKGCPIPDSDGDGLNDEEDSCPHVAGFAKYHGCPIPDRDGDGVNDEEDQCPDLPGTIANHGCPEIKSTVIERINIAAKRIFFETGKYIILRQSFSSLDTIIKIMQQDEDLKLDIDGHTDNVGTAKDNQILSENRAHAVVNYLIKKGIKNDRLEFQGFGLSRPIADNETVSGRAFNRRVEMIAHYN